MQMPFPTVRENKTVRGIGPKADNIYTVGAKSLQSHFYSQCKKKKTLQAGPPYASYSWI